MYITDSDLIQKGLDYTRRRKKWVFLFAALGFTGYGAYRVYHSPSVVRKRKKLGKLFGALISISELVSDSADAIGVVSRDLKLFLQSDSDQIPNSLKQISKIACSDEFSYSVMRVTRALTVGILRGYNSGDPSTGDSTFSDRVFDRLFSAAGSGFASVVVGSFARNLVMAIYSNAKFNGDPDSERWVDVLCDDRFKELIADCIQTFVSTAVAVYLDRTADINPYDEIFSGLTNPKHEKQTKEALTAICNGAVHTLITTSHQVMTHQDSDSNSSYTDDHDHGHDGIQSNLKKPRNSGSDWGRKMSTTLAIPSNRRFLLDLTGRVTFETVRSLMEVVFEKSYDVMRGGCDAIHDEVIERGVEVYRHITSKSSAVLTICLSLCLHILDSPWILVPA